jgi:opacity protein-like surface antigen
MKKLLLATALLATTASAGNFDQMYAGVKLDYAWPTMETKYAETSVADTKANLKSTGVEIDLFLGQNFQMNSDWTYGFELQVGHGLSESKKSFKNTANADVQAKSRRAWKFGASARMGRMFNNVLVYGRLGLNATQYSTKFTHATETKKTQSFYAWSLVPGLGAEYAISNGINARLEGTYEFGLNKSKFTWNSRKMETNTPEAFVLSAGVSFAL